MSNLEQQLEEFGAAALRVADERNEYKRRAIAADAEARESVARWMIAHSFATGHGDTLADLLDELSWQVREQLDRMLAAEARVKVLEEARPLDEWTEEDGSGPVVEIPRR